jgi:TonB family protein
MKPFLLLSSALFFITGLWSQADTTIYKAVNEMPRFPACEQLDTTLIAKQQCANQAMLQYVYQRVVYPQEAINENIEGTAVVTFVVEKDGTITQPQIVRDLGGNTGLAALKVVLLMQEDNLRWVPGKLDGKPVRVQFNLPIKFKLEDPDPFVLVGRDTVYTLFDEALDFAGGSEGLQSFLDETLDYPSSGLDSCDMGQIDVQVLVEADGNVRILNLTDYNDLGFDFWYAAIDAATSTNRKWKPAVYQGRNVNASLDLSLSFMPEGNECKAKVDRYIAALEMTDEGAALFNEEQIEAGLAKMSEAIAAFPNDAQLLMVRGQAYLSNNQFAEACADLSKAKRIALVDWFDSVLPLICK